MGIEWGLQRNVDRKVGKFGIGSLVGLGTGVASYRINAAPGSKGEDVIRRSRGASKGMLACRSGMIEVKVKLRCVRQIQTWVESSR